MNRRTVIVWVISIAAAALVSALGSSIPLAQGWGAPMIPGLAGLVCREGERIVIARRADIYPDAPRRIQTHSAYVACADAEGKVRPDDRPHFRVIQGGWLLLFLILLWPIHLGVRAIASQPHTQSGFGPRLRPRRRRRR